MLAFTTFSVKVGPLRLGITDLNAGGSPAEVGVLETVMDVCRGVLGPWARISGPSTLSTAYGGRLALSRLK